MADETAVERFKLEQQRNGGAGWFLWIASLSIINTVLVLTKTDFNFIFGLGITQFIDGLVAEAPPFVRGIGVAINIGIAAVVAGIWYLSKRYTWPFLTGMIVYAGDALIFVLVQEWIGVAFHAFALIAMVGGYKAAVKLAALPVEAQATVEASGEPARPAALVGPA